MPYIYKITNDVNGKAYIGKTMFSVEKRWKEHLAEYRKEYEQKRPLYSAMKAYGESHFHIEVLEEVSDIYELSNREIYWIEKFGTFHKGYNATKGGDGKRYLDYDYIFDKYLELCSCKDVENELGVSSGYVAKIVHLYNVDPVKYTKEKKQSSSVDMLDRNGNYIQSFNSTRSAARYMIDSKKLHPGNESGISGHIIEVCKGKRKTC